MEAAGCLLRSIIDTFGEKTPKAMEILEEGFKDAMQILFLPLPLRRSLRTSNSIERLNQEIRRHFSLFFVLFLKNMKQPFITWPLSVPLLLSY